MKRSSIVPESSTTSFVFETDPGNSHSVHPPKTLVSNGRNEKSFTQMPIKRTSNYEKMVRPCECSSKVCGTCKDVLNIHDRQLDIFKKNPEDTYWSNRNIVVIHHFNPFTSDGMSPPKNVMIPKSSSYGQNGRRRPYKPKPTEKHQNKVTDVDKNMDEPVIKLESAKPDSTKKQKFVANKAKESGPKKESKKELQGNLTTKDIVSTLSKLKDVVDDFRTKMDQFIQVKKKMQPDPTPTEDSNKTKSVVPFSKPIRNCKSRSPYLRFRPVPETQTPKKPSYWETRQSNCKKGPLTPTKKIAPPANIIAKDPLPEAEEKAYQNSECGKAIPWYDSKHKACSPVRKIILPSWNAMSRGLDFVRFYGLDKRKTRDMSWIHPRGLHQVPWNNSF